MIFFATEPDTLRSECGRFWIMFAAERWHAWRIGSGAWPDGVKLGAFETPHMAARACKTRSSEELEEQAA